VGWAIAGVALKSAAREESPDTDVPAERRGRSPESKDSGPKGNAPGNARGPTPRGIGYGKCHRNYTAGAIASERFASVAGVEGDLLPACIWIERAQALRR
jgi:hypothetical protein